jgi:hypothetical protein
VAASFVSTPVSHRHNQEEGTPMAEATGLVSAIGYADEMRRVHEANMAEIEAWTASLRANEVSGDPITAAARAAEQTQAAAAAWDQAKTALERHMAVKEAYDANPDAGSRQFVTSE